MALSASGVTTPAPTATARTRAQPRPPNEPYKPLQVTGLAVVTPDVGFVVSLAGSSFGAALIFCVPSLCFLAAKRADKTADGADAGALAASKAEVWHPPRCIGAYPLPTTGLVET